MNLYDAKGNVITFDFDNESGEPGEVVSEIKEYQGAVLSVIGDSIMAANARLVPDFMRCVDIIANKYGMEYHNHAVGGTKYTEPGDDKHSFVTQIDDITESPSIIVVGTGVNEWFIGGGKAIGDADYTVTEETYDNTKVWSSFIWFYKKLRAKFPAAYVIFLMPAGGTSAAAEWGKMDSYRDCMVETLKYYGDCAFIDTYDYGFAPRSDDEQMNAVYFADGLHWTIYAHAKVARMIEDILDKGYSKTLAVDGAPTVNVVLNYQPEQVTLSNAAKRTNRGEEYTLIVTANDGYKITSIYAVMNGVTYQATDSTITIPDVTNAIEVYVNAEGDGYTEVEYLQSDGASWIDTGYSLRKTDLVELTADLTSDSVSGWTHLCGGTISSENYFPGYTSGYIIVAHSAGHLGLTRRKDASFSSKNSTVSGLTFTGVTRAKFAETIPGTMEVYDNNGTLMAILVDAEVDTFDGLDTIAKNYGESAGAGTLFLFCMAQNSAAHNGSYAAQLKMCRFTIKDESGNVVRDFIPVLDSSDTPCMYEKVKGIYHYNLGTGAFTAGAMV